jgi:hypothetical protein
MQFVYRIIQSTNGQVQMPSGEVSTIVQMLAFAGERGGELSAVVPASPGVLEWIFKFAGQPPANMFG